MTTLNSFLNLSEPQLEKDLKSCIKLAVNMSWTVPGQFKLVETPVNSFLLVGNVLPKDIPTSDTNDELDFTSLHFPKLDLLCSNTTTTPNSVSTYGARGPDIECANISSNKCPDAIVYDGNTWMLAMGFNLDTLLLNIMDMLSCPNNWTGLLPLDPLTCLWLLFYGPKSQCCELACVSELFLGRRGPILLPPHMYKKETHINSFANHLCQYVKFLYTDYGEDIHDTPLGQDRIRDCIRRLHTITDSCVYLNRTCLLCHLYKQNDCISKNIFSLTECIILGGCGRNFLGSFVRTLPDYSSHDSIILPTYDIQKIISYMKESYGQQTSYEKIHW